MKRLVNKIRAASLRLLRDTEGAAVIEYALVAALISLVAAPLMWVVGVRLWIVYLRILFALN